jgi:hypothetical protein
MSWPDEPFLNLRQTDTPKGTPQNGGNLLYAKSDGKLYAKNAAGVESLVGPSDLTPYAPLASPTFTGNPTAPTPTAGDNDTSIATTAFVQNAISTAVAAAKLAMYPVGALYLSVTNTNPGTFLGGTWVAWGSGQVPVGVDTGQTEFNTVEKTGGEKTHVLTTAEMPSHSHTAPGGTSGGTPVNPGDNLSVNYTNQSAATGWSGTGLGGSNLTGGSQPHNNLQPYITCYMWKRTA